MDSQLQIRLPYVALSTSSIVAFFLDFFLVFCTKVGKKTVLLGERKRHTISRVSSTPWGYPIPGLGGYPRMGTPPERTWDKWPEKEPGTGYPQKGPGTSDLRKNLGWDTPGCGLTNKLKLLPSPILRLRVVTIPDYVLKKLFVQN